MSIVDEIERQRAELERWMPFLPSVGTFPEHTRSDEKVAMLQPLRATGLLLGGVRFAELMQSINYGEGVEVMQLGMFRGLTIYRLLGHEHRDLVRVIGERDPEMVR
jgi:hypothetical protein